MTAYTDVILQDIPRPEMGREMKQISLKPVSVAINGTTGTSGFTYERMERHCTGK